MLGVRPGMPPRAPSPFRFPSHKVVVISPVQGYWRPSKEFRIWWPLHSQEQCQDQYNPGIHTVTLDSLESLPMRRHLEPPPVSDFLDP